MTITTIKLLKTDNITRHNEDSKAPDRKVHGANMGPTWGRQDPCGSHVGPMNLAIWGRATFCATLYVVGSLLLLLNYILPVCGYNTCQTLCSWWIVFLSLCCLVPVSFTHIFQGYINGTWVIPRFQQLSRCQWKQHRLSKYVQISSMELLRDDNDTTTESTTKPCAFLWNILLSGK